MSTGPKKVETRGGPRAGSGRPRNKPPTISAEMRKMLLDAHDRAKKAHDGRTVGDVLMAAIYGDEASTPNQILAAKTFFEYTSENVSTQNINVTKAAEPAVYLPEERKDPADIVQLVPKVD